MFPESHTFSKITRQQCGKGGSSPALLASLPHQTYMYILLAIQSAQTGVFSWTSK